ncbi:hypothetical protein WME94_44280 [Sorangium sp. So ce429]
MAKSEPWFVADRAETQAALLWGELPILIGHKRPNERDLDLRILIDPEKTTVAEFGVVIKGALNLGDILTRAMTVRAEVQNRLRKQVAECEFPVALMVVDVRSRDTYFGWLLAPSFSRSGAAVLDTVERSHVEPATGDCLRRAIEDVRQWYRIHRASIRSPRRAQEAVAAGGASRRR